MKLSKCGYGEPKEIMQWDPVDVIVALEYEKFLVDYEQEFTKMNKEEKK